MGYSLHGVFFILAPVTHLSLIAGARKNRLDAGRSMRPWLSLQKGRTREEERKK